MFSPELLKSKFDAGLPYGAYVTSGTPEQQKAWSDFEARSGLTDEQASLVAGFTRRLNALAVSGVWCGDCVQQLPFVRHIEAASGEMVTARFLDRDAHMDLAEQITICDGTRVPVVLLLNEDFDFVGLVGDRTLARYRAMAARKLGAACPLPGAPVPDDEISATRKDWVEEFERAQLICRLSTKLRERHGD